MSSFSPFAWPHERVGDALAAAAQLAREPLRHTAAPPAPPAFRDLADAARWFAAAGDWMGVDLVEVSAPYAHVSATLRRAAPAILRIPDGRLLVLIGSAGRHALRVLTPTGARERLPLEALRACITGDDEQRIGGFVDGVLDAARVPARRREHARAELSAQRLVSSDYRQLWLVRPALGSSLARQLFASGLLRIGATLLAAHGVVYVLTLGAWALIGRRVLDGTFDGAWLLGWAALLTTSLPFRAVVLSCEGRFSIELGQLLKRRLLYGTLQLDPDTTRRAGAGALLSRVLESEAVEGLVITGGVSAGLALVEVGFVTFVLARGAGGGLLSALFILWIALAALLAVRLFHARRAWMAERLRNTHAVTERMLGHRTRLAQELPHQWHTGEDALLQAYLHASGAMDRRALEFEGVVVHAWKAVALGALLPAVLVGGTTEQIAVGIGGVLLADRCLRRFGRGLASIVDVALVWRAAAPMLRAAERHAPGSPRLLEREPTASQPSGVLLEASDLVFRHAEREEPILRGCSLAIATGDRVLLEGPSGSGKSTLAALLACLRPIDSGLLLLRGLDPASTGGAAWRSGIACVPQFHENHVLVGSLAFNVLLAGRWPASRFDLIEAEAVCREVGLGGLLERMPGGMHQVVGETGWQLSHGERSRLFLARALLQRADLVILDECFAALDPDNLERAVRAAVRRARALLVIAHP